MTIIGKFKALFGRSHREIRLVQISGLFDSEYYRLEYPELCSYAAADLLAHFVAIGWREGRNPNPFFDTNWYRDTYGIRPQDLNPLIDYIKSGALHGRNPSTRFHSEWYLDQNPDVRASGFNPLAHYMEWGKLECRAPRAPSAGTIPYARLTPYESWLAVNEISDRDIREIGGRLSAFAGSLPKISVITPVHDVDFELFEQAIQSVLDQIYGEWELCIIDDASPTKGMRKFISDLEARDKRVRVKRFTANAGISAATNAGVEMATGSVLLFLDHDDLLAPDCLAEVALYYAAHPDADIVYSDDDKIDGEGRRFAPQFKPDWSPILLLSWMYISHAFSIRRSLFLTLGGLCSELDGAQDWDLALRAGEVARRVGHIPKILYHWRARKGSTALNAVAKPLSVVRGVEAVKRAAHRRDLKVVVERPAWAAKQNAGVAELVFPHEGPSVSILVAANGGVDQLRECLSSLRSTLYRNFEVLVLVTSGQEAERALVFESVSINIRPIQVNLDSTDGLAALFNAGAQHAASEYILFFGSGLRPRGPNWLSQMVGYASMDNVGAVGPRMHATDGRIQSAGFFFGLADSLVGRAFNGVPGEFKGYLGLIGTSRECWAISGECLLTRRNLFFECGSFDQRRFPELFYGIEYCRRLRSTGFTILYCASADLTDESVGRAARVDELAERAEFRRSIDGAVDPYFNRNLSTDNEKFEVGAIRPETYSSVPIELLAVTHNLESEGAPKTLYDLIDGLTRERIVNATIVSPQDGPLRAAYERIGLKVLILDKPNAEPASTTGNLALATALHAVIEERGSEVVFANSLRSYWAVIAASQALVPSIWAQHESEPWGTYFDYLPEVERDAAYRCFSRPYRMTYVAQATRLAWSALDTRRNFKVVRHSLPARRLEEDLARWSRAVAREELRVAEDDLVITIVGTVCRRKGQIDAIEALERLPLALKPKVRLHIVGKLSDPFYADELKSARRGNERILLTDSVSDPFLYYRASDIYVCTSRVESAPRVLTEAMACGLPIVTTPVFGIPEVVAESSNALFYGPGDTRGLASALTRFLESPMLRSRFGKNSLKVLAALPDFDDMILQYQKIIREAVNLKVGPEPGLHAS